MTSISSLRDILDKYNSNRLSIQLCKNVIMAGSSEFNRKFSVVRTSQRKPASSFVKTEDRNDDSESVNKSSERERSEGEGHRGFGNYTFDPLEISYKNFSCNIADDNERLFRFLCFRLHPDKTGNDKDSLSLFITAKKARDSKNWALLTEVYFDYVYFFSNRKYSQSSLDVDLEEVKALMDSFKAGIFFQEKLINHFKSNPFYIYHSSNNPSEKMKVEIDIIRFYTELGRKRR